MTDNQTTLLPCPFCGGNAKLTTWTPTAASVSCIMCGAHFNTYTEAEAIEAWNTRHVETCEWTAADYITDGDWWNTECGTAITWEPDGVPNYCPNCGRRVTA